MTTAHESVSPLPQVRVNEWVESVAVPTIKRNGVQQYRTKRTDRYAACCLTCYATKEGDYVTVGQWQRKHRCVPVDVQPPPGWFDGAGHNDGDRRVQ